MSSIPRTVRALGLGLALCATSAASNPPADDESAAPEQQALAREAVALLAAQGKPVDLERLSLELRSGADAVDDLVRQQRRFSIPQRPELVFALLGALGLDVGADTEDFLRRDSEALAGNLRAYYQPERDALVFLSGDRNATLDMTLGSEPIVLHELVHAHQDQQGRLVELLSSQPSTDALRVAHALLEGEADALAMACLLAQQDGSLADVDPALEQPLDALFAGDGLARIYASGRRNVIARFQEGGWPAVAELLAQRPPSSEQLLHPQKLGRDEPSHVPVPALLTELGLGVEIEDVNGELELYRTLLLLGEPISGARPASAGWDGDRLALLRAGDGSECLLWRTLWDREVDAEQFADVLGQRAEGQLILRGRRVDWFAAPERWGKRIHEALSRDPAPAPADADDAASTAAVEAAWAQTQADQPQVSAGRWELAQAGIALPLPAGWEQRSVNGVQMLFESDAGGGFSPNINVQTQPRPAGLDVDALIKLNVESFAQLPTIELDDFERTRLAGVEALRLEYHGEFPGVATPLHFLAAILFFESTQVIITATTSEAQFEARAELLATTFDGVSLLDDDAAGPGR